MPFEQLRPAAAAAQGEDRAWLILMCRCPRMEARMGKSKKHREGQYVPLPYSQLKSPAWRSLSGPSVKLWLELHTRFNGSNNGRLTLSFTEAAEILGMSKGTVQRSYDELVDRGFLERTKEGNWYHRRAHEWRLTTKPMETSKGRALASNNWKDWRPPKTEHGTETDPSAPFVGQPEYRRRRHGSV